MGGGYIVERTYFIEDNVKMGNIQGGLGSLVDTEDTRPPIRRCLSMEVWDFRLGTLFIEEALVLQM